MKIYFKIYLYRLPLAVKLSLKNNEITTREGLVLNLTDEHNHSGWGEIAPLPGFSHESLDDALGQIKNLRHALNGTMLPDNLEELSGGFEKWLGKYELASSVRCGFETAVLNLIADSRRMPLCRLLSERCRTALMVNTLLNGTFDDVVEQSHKAKKLGYLAAKLKVGSHPVAEEITLIAAVRSILGDNITLRLDANRAWEFDDAVEFGRRMKKYLVEYIEEPLRDPSCLIQFHEATGLNIALDESLADTPPENYEKQPGVVAFILKPTLVGGFERTLWFIRKAHQLRIGSIISSSYETSLGLSALAHLAASIDYENRPHGLNTMNYYKEDLLTTPLKIYQGKIDLETQPLRPDIRLYNLTEING